MFKKKQTVNQSPEAEAVSEVKKPPFPETLYVQPSYFTFNSGLKLRGYESSREVGVGEFAVYKLVSVFKKSTHTIIEEANGDRNNQ